jgi:hypothetical protein
MKLYLLTAISSIGYDCYDSFMIMAPNAKRARALAQEAGGEETHREITKKGIKNHNNYHFWTSRKHSSCELFKINEHPEGIVIKSFNAG